MAKPRKLESGLWFVQINRRGQRPSRAFTSKSAAVIWAAETEREIIDGTHGNIPQDKTLADLLDKYSAEVSAHKRGQKWEDARIGLLKRDRIAITRLAVLDTTHLSDWQTRRLQVVSNESVRRERTLLSHCFNVAVNEWKWLKANPLKGVRRPKPGKPRDRIASEAEIETLLAAAPDSLKRAIIAALETGMRCGEIASNPKVVGQVAILAAQKTMEHGGRSVALSRKAVEVFSQPIGLTAGSISAEFAKLTKACKITGLTFHDLRHTAASRLSKRLDVWELCKMFGWKDPKMCLNTYYSHDVEETARKLD